MMERVILKCTRCGQDKSLSKKYASQKKVKDNYVCLECATGRATNYDNQLELICEDCKAKFTISKRYASRRFKRYGKTLCKICSRKGELNPCYGRTASAEELELLSSTKKEFYSSPAGIKLRQEQSAQSMGTGNIMYSGGPKSFTWRSKTFRMQVLTAGNFICKACKIVDTTGSSLIAHHKNGVDNFPELFMDIKNGICLCKKCHKKFHRIYGYGNNTAAQTREFLKQMKVQRLSKPRNSKLRKGVE